VWAAPKAGQFDDTPGDELAGRQGYFGFTDAELPRSTAYVRRTPSIGSGGAAEVRWHERTRMCSSVAFEGLARSTPAQIRASRFSGPRISRLTLGQAAGRARRFEDLERIAAVESDNGDRQASGA